ncbi:gephyrin-like molybdotransferase Glp [Haloimpatiens sp. FM7330]|uniref:molybdopterin molybdotransferase MoeA n=1 Tax=Haloimpatiens sp. FM7330 TaxID=3298610 RepID=UPI00363DD727
MISIDEALNIINKETKVLEPEEVDLMKSLNSVLAENIYSKDNLPPFNKSAMDGYAIKSEDTKECNDKNKIKLTKKAIIKAGDYYEGELEKGQAIKIMTGAAVPKGANAVIKIEKIVEDKNQIIISEHVKEGNNIIKFGDEIKVGQLALEKGKIITPTEIGILASLGYSKVKVYRKPKISIVTTGNELMDINSKLEKGKVRNSNEYSLKALCIQLGSEVESLGVVTDDKEYLKQKIMKALDKSDIVISSGGVSVGDYDFVEDVLGEIGADVKITSIAIKPGKPTTFATVGDKLFFGLPGNPLSVLTTFEEFVKPTIEKMMGKDGFNKKYFKVIAADNFKLKQDRRKYVYVEIKKKDEKYYAYEVGSQCSNYLMTRSRANGVMIIPEGVSSAKAGEVLDGRFMYK